MRHHAQDPVERYAATLPTLDGRELEYFVGETHHGIRLDAHDPVIGQCLHLLLNSPEAIESLRHALNIAEALMSRHHAPRPPAVGVVDGTTEAAEEV